MSMSLQLFKKTTMTTPDLFTTMNMEPVRLQSFFNTTGISGKELKEATISATAQDALVLASITRLKQAGASDIWHDLSEAFLLTSVRRSLTALKDRGLVVKTSERKKGITKASEKVWKYVEQV